MVYSTRSMPGWKEVAEPYRCMRRAIRGRTKGSGELGVPRLDVFTAQFIAAAKKTGVEEAWLRAIAHAESDFNPRARSPKGAQGVMQLMPALSRAYGVTDPYSSAQSIDCAARHIRELMRLYKGDLALVAAPTTQARARGALQGRAALRGNRGLRGKGAGALCALSQRHEEDGLRPRSI
jgi:soluble lytic murein transglycosylase-like protein